MSFNFITIIIIILTGIIYSQSSLDAQYNKAMILYENGEYFDAVTEFQRLLFFDNNKEFTYKANRLIGECYKNGARFSDAIIYFTYSEISAKNDSELFKAKIDIIRANILRRTTERALELLKQITSDKRFSDKIKITYYWEGWSYIFADKWDKAADAFANTDTNETLSQFCRNVHEEKYSVLFADILSHVIPGAGQFYTGHYLSGLLSLGWNILWGYVTINAFVSNRIFDGIMVGNLLWFRFYRGNFNNATKFAEENNLAITNKALHYLQYNFVGLKP